MAAGEKTQRDRQASLSVGAWHSLKFTRGLWVAYSLRFLQRVYLPRQVGASLRFLLSFLNHSGVNQFASSSSAIRFGNNLLSPICIRKVSRLTYPLITLAVKTEVA